MIGEYVDYKTNILFHCKIHDIDFTNHPARVLNGVRCPQCSKENLIKSKTKTHEWYLNELKIKNPFIIPIEKYINIKTPIMHKCLIHNIEWETAPNNVLLGCGCKKCLSEKISIKNFKSHKLYLQELQNKQLTIQPLEEYKGADKKILHQCLVCEHIWKVRPANLLSGRGCPNCSNCLKRTPKQYIELVKKINPNIEVLDNYINANIPIQHKCKIHNYIWKTTPASILSGTGCILCGFKKTGDKLRKSSQKFEEELKSINPNIVNVETYQNNNVKILFHCLKCDYEWKAIPSNILKGSGCPHCKHSKGEEVIEQWLKRNNIKYEPQKVFDNCKDVRHLPFDFFLPERKICIEYDGLQHFKSIDYFGGQDGLEYIQKHDKIKNQFCEDNRILLLRISYDANIEKELKNFLFN